MARTRFYEDGLKRTADTATVPITGSYVCEGAAA